MYLNFIHKNLVVTKLRPDIITHLEFNSVTKSFDNHAKLITHLEFNSVTKNFMS